jgi:hypothetical protein
MFFQMKKMNHYQGNLKKNTMPFASVEDLGCTIFMGKNVQV